MVAGGDDEAYRRALRGYGGALLRRLWGRHSEEEPRSSQPSALSQDLAERLRDPLLLDRALAGLSAPAREALAIPLAREESTLPLRVWRHAMRALGRDGARTALEVFEELAESGLVALAPEPRTGLLQEPRTALAAALGLGSGSGAGSGAETGFGNGNGTSANEGSGSGAGGATIAATLHPALMERAPRTLTLPERGAPTSGAEAVGARESDGLEPVLRLAALWQRVLEHPPRRSRGGPLYKRDRDRLEGDPALSGPIADAPEPLPDPVPLWLSLARAVGLVVEDADGERLLAASADYWSEHGFHLPIMLSVAWLRADRWHERLGAQEEGVAASMALALPHARAGVLLRLATAEPEAWVAIEDLAASLRADAPDWDALLLPETAAPGRVGEEGAAGGPNVDSGTGPGASKSGPGASRAKGKSKVRAGGGAGGDSGSSGAGSAARALAASLAAGSGGGGDAHGVETLRAMLLGAAYQLNLTATAEEAGSGRTLVRLTRLGRYVLGQGPPPEPRPSFEKFLYVQPNHEMIAYRQGLNPGVAGQLGRFLRWTKFGGAVELRLTADSVYHGLQGGLTADQMIARLEKHSQRPPAAGIVEAIRSWSARRERVTFHMAATLLEFATREERDAALREWPGEPLPRAVNDRLLLVESAGAIPFQRFRLVGSRDYRLPREACVEVEPDGVTLRLDPSRSDLLVDAELEKFAESLGPEAGARLTPRDGEIIGDGLTRRYRVSRESLARGLASGTTGARLERWFPERCGTETPAAIRLLLDTLREGDDEGRPSAEASRTWVLRADRESWLDGIAQHPATRGLVGARLGPLAIEVARANLDALREALESIGVRCPKSWPSAGEE